MDIKQLAKVIALCRKLGVTTFKQGDTEFTLGQDPKAVKQRIRPSDPANDIPEAQLRVPAYMPIQSNPDENKEKSQALREALDIASDELTYDQLLNYSAVNPADYLTGEQ